MVRIKCSARKEFCKALSTARRFQDCGLQNHRRGTVYLYVNILLEATSHVILQMGGKERKFQLMQDIYIYIYYWPSTRLRWLDISRVLFFHKNAKSERGQYPAILIELAWCNKEFIIWYATPSCRFVFSLLCLPDSVAKCILETYQRFCFRLSLFLAPPRRRNHRKSLYCHGKYFAKVNFRAHVWTLTNFIAGTKRVIPNRQYRSILPARVANYSVFLRQRDLHALFSLRRKLISKVWNLHLQLHAKFSTPWSRQSN